MAGISEIVNTARYPLEDPDGARIAEVLSALRSDLRCDGCAVLKGFVHDKGLAQLVAEADRVAPEAHRSHSRTNAYFSADDPDLPKAHPVRRFYDRSNAFIPADNFPAQGPLRRIYEWPAFMPFIRAALEEPEDRFYRYDDPLADVIINMVEDGPGFPWHFDTNNYTVTLAIQNAEEGGDFEYAPALRTSDDERFDDVQQVLDGQSEAVRRLVLEPGDLQIFRGRYSLHRVTATHGARRRYVGIFSFVEKEGMCGGVERTKQLYGRVLPLHHERAGWRDDALRD